ncbi:MAG: hypothetical protein K6G26_13595 [Lachnospiraceae bacterium]|nr:hypothetical protein [Lachnospiraceae bacterium]
MGKKIVLIILAVVVIGAAGFVVWDKVLNTEQKDNKPVTEKDTKEEQNDLEEPENDDYKEAYLKVIDETEKEYPEEEIKYDLIYFNDDDIPDLVLGHEGFWVSLYIYDNGEVYYPVEQWGYGAGGNAGYDYYEKKGVIANCNADMAGLIMSEVTSILNDRFTFDTFIATEKGADLDPNDPEYEELSKKVKEELDSYGGYYLDDHKISKEDYDKALKDFPVLENLGDSKFLYGTKSLEEIKEELK